MPAVAPRAIFEDTVLSESSEHIASKQSSSSRSLSGVVVTRLPSTVKEIVDGRLSDGCSLLRRVAWWMRSVSSPSITNDSAGSSQISLESEVLAVQSGNLSVLRD